MTTSPTANTVARSRYWLASALRLGSTLLAVWGAAGVVRGGVSATLYLVGDSGVSIGTGVTSFWLGGGSNLIWIVVAAAAFIKSRWLATAVFPTVGAHCPRCGYSRRGLLTTAPCPECGARNEPQAG